MLVSLSIRNVVLIDKLDLSFGSGLGVFTGETGAGKSILLDSLSLILGARSDAKLVRLGQDQLSVSAEFSNVSDDVKALLDHQGIIVEDDSVLVRRVVTKEGKSKAFVNDVSVGLAFLKSLGSLLVEIHGQFATHSLLDASTHLGVIDSFAGLSLEVEQTATLYQSFKQIHKERIDAEERFSLAQKEKDFLEHSVSELEELNPLPDEEVELTQKRTDLMNSEKILNAVNVAYQILADDSSGVQNSLNKALRQLEKATSYSTAFEGIMNTLYQSQDLILDATSQIESITDSWGDISELPLIDDRLFALRAMARKHRTDIASLVQLKEKYKNDLALLDEADTSISVLKEKEEKARESFFAQAFKLSEMRKKAALELDKRVMAELPALKLEKAVFSTQITQKPLEEATETGIDSAVLMVSTNKGAPLLPIHKVASGGELSRFMLALKVNLASSSSLPTLVFDEVDSGVGGAVADAIGMRLFKLGSVCQVLTVTHAPQVAVYGSMHWTVKKSDETGSVITRVNKLDEDARLKEVARMLSGASVSQTALEMAQELLFKAREI